MFSYNQSLRKWYTQSMHPSNRITAKKMLFNVLHPPFTLSCLSTCRARFFIEIWKISGLTTFLMSRMTYTGAINNERRVVHTRIYQFILWAELWDIHTQSFWSHYTGQPETHFAWVKNWRILPKKSFTASMPLLTANSALVLLRRH